MHQLGQLDSQVQAAFTDFGEVVGDDDRGRFAFGMPGFRAKDQHGTGALAQKFHAGGAEHQPACRAVAAAAGDHQVGVHGDDRPDQLVPGTTMREGRRCGRPLPFGFLFQAGQHTLGMFHQLPVVRVLDEILGLQLGSIENAQKVNGRIILRSEPDAAVDGFLRSGTQGRFAILRNFREVDTDDDLAETLHVCPVIRATELRPVRSAVMVDRERHADACPTWHSTSWPVIVDTRPAAIPGVDTCSSGWSSGRRPSERHDSPARSPRLTSFWRHSSRSRQRVRSFHAGS